VAIVLFEFKPTKNQYFMRILTRLALLMSAVAIVLFSAGCDSDTPGGGGVTLPPVVTLNSGTDLISFNQERALFNPAFIVSISGEDGDAALRDLSFLENGLSIPADQLDFRTGQTANNPILAAGTDVGGFTYEVGITPSNTAVGPVTFSFRLTDVDGEIATTEVTVTYTATPPIIDLLVEDGFVSGDATVTNFNTNFDVKVLLDDTVDSLATLTILENGTAMDAAQLTYTGFTAANPLQLIPAEAVGVTYTININPDVTMMETRTYTFQVADVNGITAERSVVVSFDPPASNLTFDTTGVFFNASGGGDGGLDLDNGMAVPFNSPDAEIEDEGIDLDSGDENWRTQISATNDAVLKVVDLSMIGDGTTFDDVVTIAVIDQAFDEGTTPDGNDAFPDADGDVSRDELVTKPMQEGDVYAVRRDGRTYLVRIDEINFVAGSNNDNYKVSIKY
jgi:hypothetical protein